MAKTVYKVNDPEIKFWVKNNIRFDAKPDGNGLYLRFRQNDRYPAFSFVLNSLVLRIKSCWVSYPRLSLAAARLERDTHRNRLDAGYNPARLKREKKAEDAEKDLIEKSAETVGQLINEFFHAEINDQVKTAIPIKQAMDKYILENLGELKIEAVKPLHIRAMLKSIASPTVARKVLSLTKRMFNYAIKNGTITVNPAAAFNTKDTGGAQDPRKRYLEFAQKQ